VTKADTLGASSRRDRGVGCGSKRKGEALSNTPYSSQNPSNYNSMPSAIYICHSASDILRTTTRYCFRPPQAPLFKYESLLKNWRSSEFAAAGGGMRYSCCAFSDIHSGIWHLGIVFDIYSIDKGGSILMSSLAGQFIVDRCFTSSCEYSLFTLPTKFLVHSRSISLPRLVHFPPASFYHTSPRHPSFAGSDVCHPRRSQPPLFSIFNS
jgi:hypothetical protein